MSPRTARSKRTRLANRRRLNARPLEIKLIVTPEMLRTAQLVSRPQAAEASQA